MHDDEAQLRATLAQVVLTDLRAGRPQLTPGALAALRILAAGSGESLPVRTEPVPVPAESPAVPAADERARRPLRRVGAVVGIGAGIAALAGALFLAGAGDHSPSPGHDRPTAMAAPSPPVQRAAPPVPGTGTPSPAHTTASAGDAWAPALPDGPPAPATVHSRATAAGGPPVVDRPAADPVRPNDAPSVIDGPPTAPPAPYAQAAGPSSTADPAGSAP